MTAHDAPSFESLIAQLQDKSSAVRVEAAKQLGDLHDPRAIEPLAALLKHFDKNSQMAAAHALGEINDPLAIERLSEALKHTYFETFDAVKEALEKLGAGDVANKVSTERQQTNTVQENKEGGRSLLLWGAGLLGIGLLCSFGSYGMASIRASQQAASKGFGNASYVVLSGPILIGGILLAIGFFRSQGAVHVGKIAASIAVGFFAFFDVIGLLLAVTASTKDIPDAILIPIVLGILVGALLLAIRLAVRSWRDIIIAAGLAFLLFCVVSSVYKGT